MRATDCSIKEAGSRYHPAKRSNEGSIQTQTVELDMVFGHPLQFSLPRAKEVKSS